MSDSLAPVTSIPLSAPRPAARDILEEHLEEMGFLWMQRRRLLFSPDVPLRRLPNHDERIEAHADGLTIGRATSVEVALERLEDENPWIAAAALRTWLLIGAPDSATALARFDEMPPAFAPAWREALRWSGADTVERVFTPGRATALPPAPFALAIEGLAWHGLLPEAAATHAARHEAAPVREAIARVLAWPGTSTAAHDLLPRLIEDTHPAVRHRARWSAALRDAPSICERLRAARPSQLDAFDAQLLGLFGDIDDIATLSRLAEMDVPRMAALRALGDLGSEAAVEALLRVLRIPNEAVQLAATAGLERALGPVGGAEEGDEPKPAPPATAEGRWQELSESLPRGAVLCRGLARPWAGEKRDEPMLWRWRAALLATTGETRILTQHVPDGFWEASPSIVATPGE